MASWVTPTIHVTGDDFSVTDNNTLATNEIFLYQAPACNVYNSVATSLPNATIESVTLGGTTYSAYGFSVTGGNTVVFPLAGNYWVMGQVYLSMTSGYCDVGLYQNGSLVLTGIASAGAAGVLAVNTSGVVNFPAAGGAMSMLCTQTSGATVTTNTGAGLTFFSAFFIGSN